MPATTEMVWITNAQAAAALNVTPGRISQLITAGAIVAVPTPLGVLVYAPTVEAYRHQREERNEARAAAQGR